MQSKVFFLRHGRTKYTGEGLDLTPEGEMQVRNAAKKILERVGDGEYISIISSGTPRAFGSASILAECFSQDVSEILIEPALRCCDFYTSEASQLPWPSIPGEKSLEVEYVANPRFDKGEEFEKRSDIKERFFKYLRQLFRQFEGGALPDFMVHTGHYEALHHLIRKFGLDTPLMHAEVIEMVLSKEEGQSGINVIIKFKDNVRSCTVVSPYEPSDYL